MLKSTIEYGNVPKPSESQQVRLRNLTSSLPLNKYFHYFVYNSKFSADRDTNEPDERIDNILKTLANVQRALPRMEIAVFER